MCTCIVTIWMVCGGVSLATDSTSGVCRYVSSQVDGMHVCMCAFYLYVGGRYAFVVVPMCTLTYMYTYMLAIIPHTI